jgi:phage baseplate assembly protein W
MAINTTYQDIDISFTMHPSTKDVLKLYDVSAAKYSLKSLLLTIPGENLNDAHFGIGIKRLQFELAMPVFKAFVKRNIINQVLQYLPEISIQNLEVGTSLDTGEMNIIIQYLVKGNLKLQTYNLVLERSR